MTDWIARQFSRPPPAGPAGSFSGPIRCRPLNRSYCLRARAGPGWHPWSAAVLQPV